MDFKLVWNWNGRWRKILFLVILFGAGLLYFALYSGVERLFNEDYEELGLGSGAPLEDLGYLVNATGCKIRRTPIFPKYFQAKWHLDKNPDCAYEQLFTKFEEEEQVVRLLNPNSWWRTCCLHEILRKENEDEGYNLSPCEELKTTLDISQKEMLLTKCGTSLNFDYNFVSKPSVQAKLDFWSNMTKNGLPLPPNIILFGSDTLSRSQAYRSLPTTLEYLKGLGFWDFKGYHSAGGTFSNYVSFLMGMRRVESMAHCAPLWSSSYDTCPFIWNEFSSRNYVTMYIEDGHQTFNWGGQGGFIKKPTDYYLHSLFSAIKDLRPKYSPMGHRAEHNLDCTSNETVPEFVVRTTKRFFQKFRSTPFFSFTWLGDPFHDNPYALGNLDLKILNMFQTLAADPALLERTFIIFLSDHGDRFSLFRTKSAEGFLERGLPLFLMRVPNAVAQPLRQSGIDLERALKSNTQLLTAPTDLHHTIKHILHLNPVPGSSPVPFTPVLEDRISLFLEAESNRTCDTLRLDNCVCNTFLTDYYGTTPAIELSEIVAFAEKKLNAIVSASKYASLCAEWSATTSTIISSQILMRDGNTTQYLMQFRAMADYGNYAKFEARILARPGLNNVKPEFELVGEFERVDAYGTQSHCVVQETEADKKMKELCRCK